MIWLIPVLASAAVDWFAIDRGYKRLEYVFKPMTMVLLIVAGLTLYSPGDTRAQLIPLIAALVLSLAGDVFLMLPGDRFIPGLAAFLGAHVAYLAVFVPHGAISARSVILWALLVVATIRIGARVVQGLRASQNRSLVTPVVAYMVVITTMVMAALATGQWWVMVGATLFYASDSLIGWNRFVEPVWGGRVAIHVTYHLGQIALVAGALAL